MIWNEFVLKMDTILLKTPEEKLHVETYDLNETKYSKIANKFIYRIPYHLLNKGYAILRHKEVAIQKYNKNFKNPSQINWKKEDPIQGDHFTASFELIEKDLMKKGVNKRDVPLIVGAFDFRSDFFFYNLRKKHYFYMIDFNRFEFKSCPSWL